jgi:ribosomal protein S18 acetylase RimI-like enzyme
VTPVGEPGRYGNLRAATDADEPFMYDVFCTSWEDEAAAMPDPRLVRHFLRIQYTAHEDRLNSRFPGHDRYVVVHEGKDAGRFYLHRSPTVLHAIELTLLPEFRSRGIGNRIAMDVAAEAAELGKTVSLRVSKRNARAADLYRRLGLRLVTVDDLDHYFEFDPAADEITA